MLKTPYRSRKSAERTPSIPGQVLHDSNTEFGQTTAVSLCRKSGVSFTLPSEHPLSEKAGWRRMQSSSRFIVRVKSHPVKPHLSRTAWNQFTFLHNLTERHVQLISHMTVKTYHKGEYIMRKDTIGTHHRVFRRCRTCTGSDEQQGTD